MLLSTAIPSPFSSLGTYRTQGGYRPYRPCRSHRGYWDNWTCRPYRSDRSCGNEHHWSCRSHGGDRSHRLHGTNGNYRGHRCDRAGSSNS